MTNWATAADGSFRIANQALGLAFVIRPVEAGYEISGGARRSKTTDIRQSKAEAMLFVMDAMRAPAAAELQAAA